MNPLILLTGAAVGVSVAWWLWQVGSGRTGRRQGLAIAGVGLVGIAVGWAAIAGWLPDWLASVGLALTAMAGGALVFQPGRAIRG